MSMLSAVSVPPLEALAAHDRSAGFADLRRTRERTRRALEDMLHAGMQVIDGDSSALESIPQALAVVIARLHEMHDAREASTRGRSGARASRVLASHAEFAKRADVTELSRLSDAVARASDPCALARSVVVSGLVLMSNLFDCEPG